MVLKIAVSLCLIGLAHAGNLFGGSELGYSSGLGYGQGHGALGFGANQGYGSAYASGLGYGNLGFSPISHGSGLGYSSLGHGSSLGYRPAYSALGHSAGFEHNGYGGSAYSSPAISSVAINKYLGPATPYSTGFGAHGAYNPVISGGYGNSGYGAHNSYASGISNAYGYGGYRYEFGQYGNKW